MSRRLMPALVLLVVLLPGLGRSQSIGIFLDPEASSCSAEVGSTPFIALHIVALLGGDVPEFSTAQFSIIGLPETWSPANVFWVLDTGVGISVGNPLFSTSSDEYRRGAIVTFADFCRGDDDPAGDVGPIPIGRVIIAGAPTPENTILRVWRYELVQTDPVCPFMLGCSDINTKICVEGGRAVLNPTSLPACEVVAVEQLTWAGVKDLYR